MWGYIGLGGFLLVIFLLGLAALRGSRREGREQVLRELAETNAEKADEIGKVAHRHDSGADIAQRLRDDTF